jgi:hypothetical protein
MSNPKFLQSTCDLLDSWFSAGGDIEEKDLTLEIKNDLLQFYKAPTEEITLYRGILKVDNINGDEIIFNFINSWTYDLEVAKNFAENITNTIIKIKTKNIFLDSTAIHPDYLLGILGGFPEEHEVILNAGTYKILELIKSLNLFNFTKLNFSLLNLIIKNGSLDCFTSNF